jgi:spore germination cell wall hydrolase CwlJ-like protein
LFKNVQTRENARALFGAAMTGSAVGLILAGAYFGGSMAQSRQADEAAVLAEVSAPATAAPTTVAATINQAGVQSGQLLHASLAGPAAKPFQYAAARTATDLDCLTEAVYYEARGEGPAGEAAVAQVVLNRVRHPAFPNTICGVVFQGCQFSFACNGAMNRHREPAAWREARRIAKRALAGAVVANIGNATHFHTLGVDPAWGPRLMRVAQVGYHVFYRMGGRAGRPGAFSAQPQPSTDSMDAAPTIENAPVLASIVPTPASALAQAVFTSGPAAPKVQLVDPATTALSRPAEAVAAPKVTVPAAAQAASAPTATKVEVSTTAPRSAPAPASTAS